MIHLAFGLLIVSLTTLALTVASLVQPAAPQVSTAFGVGAVVAPALSSALVVVVRRLRL